MGLKFKTILITIKEVNMGYIGIIIGFLVLIGLVFLFKKGTPTKGTSQDRYDYYDRELDRRDEFDSEEKEEEEEKGQDVTDEVADDVPDDTDDSGFDDDFDDGGFDD